MEGLMWDIHQIISELQALPGALIETDRHAATSIVDVTNNAAAHRRALRRLDRALKQLETELQNQLQQQQQEEENNQEQCDDLRGKKTDQNNSKDDMNKEDIGLHQDSQDSNSNPWQSAHCTASRSSNGSRSHNCNSIDQTNRRALDKTSSTELLIPQPLQDDLKIILTRLIIPVHQEDMSVGQLSALILEKTAYFWVNYGCGVASNRALQDGEVAIMLDRLLGCRNSDIHSSDIRNVSCTASSAWLEVLITYFMVSADAERNEDSPEFQTWLIIHCLPAFLRSALEMVQATPWEPVAVNDVVTETLVQWRILTGYLIEYTIQLQQQQLLGDPTAPDLVTGADVEPWLHNRFREANPSLLPENITDNVHDLLATITDYVFELAEYALDALDGAAVAFSTATSTSSEHKSKVSFYLDQASQNTDSVAEYQEPEEAPSFDAAESAIQDSLRHVTLATNALTAVQQWCSEGSKKGSHIHRLQQVQQQQLVNLWNTMASSFMAKSNFTTVLNHATTKDEDNGMNLAVRMCEHQLQLANLVLSSPLEIQQQANGPPGSIGGYEKTLALTFLRALDFPDQLLKAEKLWQAIEQRVRAQPLSRSGINLKRTLQAAVLTLRRQHMLSAGSCGGGGGGSAQQHRAQAIIDRLLPILLRDTGDNPRECHPWDSFFMSSLGFVLSGPKD